MALRRLGQGRTNLAFWPFTEAVIVATGSDPNNLQSTGVVDELPLDTRFDIVVHCSIPVAFIGDLVGMEQLIQLLYDVGGEVIDVEGVGGSEIIIHCHGSPLPIPAIIWVIAAAGFITWLISSVDVVAFMQSAGDVLKWGAIIAVVLGGLYLLSTVKGGIRRISGATK